jgi:hypothetical protein
VKLIVIFGPPAVGKMTVGHELSKLTGMRLFHNHMTIDLVLNFFNYGEPQFNKLVNEFRRRVFEEVSTSQLPGLIFTYVWSLGHAGDKEYVDGVCAIFRQQDAEVYFVELEAPLAERVVRNASEFRLTQKPSKRDVKHTEHMMRKHETEHRMNSNGDFFYRENYIKIDNSNLPPAETALKIVQAFGFETLPHT